jgi:hypothetical protein
MGDRKKKLGKKLTLEKQVIRKLAGDDLDRVQGGTDLGGGGPVAIATLIGCTVKITITAKQSGGCA